jgi:filamentous hemagglutinin
VGGTAGAMTAVTVDANNRQLHPDEKALAKQLARKSGGKYTAEQIEEQMRGMSMTRNGVTEVGVADVVVGAVVPSDNAGTWVYVGSTQDGKPIIMQKLADEDAALRTFIVRNTTGSEVPSLITYAGPYVAPSVVRRTTSLPIATAACRYGDANCAAGLQPPMTASELMKRRELAADFASDISRQSGRFAAAATAYGTYLASQPNPVSQTGATVQFGLAGTATAVGLGAQGVEQALRPDAGKAVSEGAVDVFVHGVSGKLPGLGPAITEAGEQFKGSSTIKDRQESINNIFKK